MKQSKHQAETNDRRKDYQKRMPDESYSLINGIFSSKEARDILLKLFEYKINFHELKNFSMEERYGEKDQKSVKRIEELKETRSEIKEMVEWAIRHGYKLKINSTVNIQFEKQ